MKKDKEWLKEQIKDEEIDLKYAFDNYVPYEKVLIADDVNELINQLEEPEQEKEKLYRVKVGNLYMLEDTLRHTLVEEKAHIFTSKSRADAVAAEVGGEVEDVME